MSILGFGAIDVGAFAGFAHFEPTDLARQPKEIASRLRHVGTRHKMVFSDLFLCFGNDLIERCVNFPDRSIRDTNLEVFRGVSEFCRLADIPGVTLCPGVNHPTLGRSASLDVAIEELARLSEVGKQAGLRVSFEPHLESITESPQDALKVVADVPHLTLTLDYSHFVAQGYSTAAIEPMLAHTGHFHVRQARQGQAQARGDSGTIDFDRALSLLRSAGYNGWVAFEYEWNAWQGNNQVDVVSETILLKRKLAHFESTA